MKLNFFNIILFVLFSLLNIFAQTIETEKTHILQLKKFYFQRDYESAKDYLNKILKKHNNSELLAWQSISVYPFDYDYKIEKDLGNLVKQNNEDIWANFSLATVYVNGGRQNKHCQLQKNCLAKCLATKKLYFYTRKL